MDDVTGGATTDGRPAVWSEAVGDGRPTLLLLHGLGSTGEVWRGLAAEAAGPWPGRVLLVDLPGHGRSARLPAYTYEAHADAVRPLLGGGPAVAVGHSMGGVVALVLAGRAGANLAAAIGVGIKCRWSDDDAAGMRHLAGRPGRRFGSRTEAAAWYLRTNGLDGIVAVDDPMIASGLADGDAGGDDGDGDGDWGLALDQAAFGVGVPDLARYLAAARCPVALARGARDQLVSLDDMAALHPDPAELPGLGHNAHVEDPAAVWRFVEERLAAAGAMPR
jgi:pimeloyl-ACP methyl ester carboxylesterase